MKTIEEHRIVIREIADYAFNFGVEAVGVEAIKKGLTGGWDKEIQDLFYTKCHEGFKIAQNKIVEEVKYYQALYRAKTASVKESRRKRDKGMEKSIGNEIKIINQRLHTLSHMADGIAWQILGGQIHIARQFHIGEDSSKFLDSSNIESAKKVADQINENPMDFALISDLTGFIQIGDLLVRRNKSLQILELKEGKMNEVVSEFLDDLEKTGRELDADSLKETFDEKTIKQIKRVRRQVVRGQQATEIMRTDKGIDPASGAHMSIGTPTIPTEFYHKELEQLQEQLKSNTWSYTVIDACLHIGMYRDAAISGAGFIIKEILKHQTPNFIIVDWLSITQNLSEPIFAKPFHPDFIVDVLTGRVKIIMGINMDILIELFDSLGLKARWLSEKETQKMKQKIKGKGMVIVNKRGIGFTLPGEPESVMIGGMLSKFLYDNIKPSNLALSYLSMTKPG